MKQKAQLKQITATKHAAKWTKLCSCRLHWYFHQLQKSLTHRIVVSLQPGVALAHRLKVRTSHRALCTISASPVHNDSPPSVCCALKCSADMHYLAVPWCWRAPIVPSVSLFFAWANLSMTLLLKSTSPWTNGFSMESMERAFSLCCLLYVSFLISLPTTMY